MYHQTQKHDTWGGGGGGRFPCGLFLSLGYLPSIRREGEFGSLERGRYAHRTARFWGGGGEGFDVTTRAVRDRSLWTLYERFAHKQKKSVGHSGVSLIFGYEPETFLHNDKT